MLFFVLFGRQNCEIKTNNTLFLENKSIQPSRFTFPNCEFSSVGATGRRQCERKFPDGPKLWIKISRGPEIMNKIPRGPEIANRISPRAQHSESAPSSSLLVIRVSDILSRIGATKAHPRLNSLAASVFGCCWFSFELIIFLKNNQYFTSCYLYLLYLVLGTIEVKGTRYIA